MAVTTQKALLPKPDRHHLTKWPWSIMKVGEMFFVPDRTHNTMTTLAWSTGVKLGKKFPTRMIYMRKTREGWVQCEKTHRNAVYGIGVWRTA